MRERWRRAEGVIDLGAGEIESLIRPAIAGASVVGFSPAEGGLANTNISVRLSQAPWRVLLRLYQRDPAAVWRELALNRLVLRHDVPTAAFLHAEDTNAVTGGSYAVLAWADGRRLETVIPEMTAGGFPSLARSIGTTLAAIHGIAFDRTGFLDADLKIAEPVDLGREGLLAYLRECLIEGLGGERLGSALTDELMDFVRRNGVRLDSGLGRPCLTHADFNGSNILVRPDSKGGFEVAAVLDWEFAFSGAPAIDFGNLLRPPLAAEDGFAADLARVYRAAGGELPADWRVIAGIIDLFAWADFLNRPEAAPALIEDARRIVRRTIGAA
jgi:aminoglycoside phosphotransferase (APT) family kinase protein